ncbi:MAG: SHD1 domain-containing protein [Pirellulaceae bacterium]|nr:SHD1 domain-containing protein [Pirellulaceae bacterium]
MQAGNEQRSILNRLEKSLRWAIVSGLPLLIALQTITAAAQSNDSDEYRIWTDSTGQHKVNAKLVDQSEKEVTLEKTDGSKVTLALDKLSEGDRQFLRSMPAKLEPEVDPFSGGQPLAEIQRPQNQHPRESNTSRSPVAKPEGDSSSPRQPAEPAPEHHLIHHGLRPTTNWNYKPEPMPDPGPRSNSRMALTSPIADGEIADARFSADGRVLLVYMKSFDAHALILLDLMAGKVICRQKLPSSTQNVAISPSGSRIATKDFFDWKSIDIWDLHDNRLTRTSKSINTSSNVFFGLNRLFFVDESHLFTIGNNSFLVDIEQQRVEYEMPMENVLHYHFLASDGKHLGVRRENGMDLLRLTDSQVVGSLNFVTEAESSRRFYPDIAWNERHLMALADRERQLWNLQTGQKLASFPMSVGDSQSRTHFVSDSLILHGEDLYHIDVPTSVWRYTWPTNGRVLFDRDRCWLLTTEALIPIPLLDSKRLQEIDRMVNTIKNYPFLKRGTRMKLDVDFRHMGNLGEEAKSILLKRLQEIGVTIDDTATLQLRADVRRHRPTTLTKSFRRNGQFERATVEIRPLVYDLMLVEAGRVVWRVHETPEISEAARGNETAQEIQARLENPSTDFFANCELPTKLSPQIISPTPGASKISADGVVE